MRIPAVININPISGFMPIYGDPSYHQYEAHMWECPYGHIVVINLYVLIKHWRKNSSKYRLTFCYLSRNIISPGIAIALRSHGSWVLLLAEQSSLFCICHYLQTHFIFHSVLVTDVVEQRCHIMYFICQMTNNK